MISFKFYVKVTTNSVQLCEFQIVMRKVFFYLVKKGKWGNVKNKFLLLKRKYVKDQFLNCVQNVREKNF